MPAERRVRFTEGFFDHLETLLPEERGADGRPSVTDFIVFEVPPMRDRLAADAVAATLPTKLSGVRVYIGSGFIVPTIAVFLRIDDHDVEVFWVSLGLAW